MIHRPAEMTALPQTGRRLCVSEMISGSVLISDAVFLELVNALNQYSDEEEEGHNDSEVKQEDGKEELPVTRKRKRIAAEGGFGHRDWGRVGHVSSLPCLRSQPLLPCPWLLLSECEQHSRKQKGNGLCSLSLVEGRSHQLKVW